MATSAERYCNGEQMPYIQDTISKTCSKINTQYPDRGWMLTVRMEFSFPCKFFHKKIGGIGKMFYLCNTNGIKYTIMATITLDNSTYNDAAMYAKLHNISIAEALKVGMKFLMENFRLQADRKSTRLNSSHT